MAEISEVWSASLPQIRDSVTGVGVWTALNACRPIALEDGVLVIGLASNETELIGHLRLPAARSAIEGVMSAAVGARLQLRIIEGGSLADWQTVKEQDAVKRRLQDQALDRARKEISAKSTWEGTYEKLSRKYAETPNRSLPQNRARYLMDAVEIVADALIETPVTDDMSERNFARCIERIAQHAEVPSALVAAKVLQRAFER